MTLPNAQGFITPTSIARESAIDIIPHDGIDSEESLSSSCSKKQVRESNVDVVRLVPDLEVVRIKQPRQSRWMLWFVLTITAIGIISWLSCSHYSRAVWLTFSFGDQADVKGSKTSNKPNVYFKPGAKVKFRPLKEIRKRTFDYYGKPEYIDLVTEEELSKRQKAKKPGLLGWFFPPSAEELNVTCDKYHRREKKAWFKKHCQDWKETIPFSKLLSLFYRKHEKEWAWRRTIEWTVADTHLYDGKGMVYLTRPIPKKHQLLRRTDVYWDKYHVALSPEEASIKLRPASSRICNGKTKPKKISKRDLNRDFFQAAPSTLGD